MAHLCPHRKRGPTVSVCPKFHFNPAKQLGSSFSVFDSSPTVLEPSHVVFRPESTIHFHVRLNNIGWITLKRKLDCHSSEHWLIPKLTEWVSTVNKPWLRGIPRFRTFNPCALNLSAPWLPRYTKGMVQYIYIYIIRLAETRKRGSHKLPKMQEQIRSDTKNALKGTQQCDRIEQLNVLNV